MSDNASRKPKRPQEVSVKKAANGGYIVRHSYDNMGAGESYQPPKEHAFTKHSQMMKHVGEAMGDEGGTYDPAPDVTGTPDKGEKRPSGVAGKAKTAPPTKRAHGAGAD